MQTIEQLRKQIDEIDEKLFGLLDKRFDVSIQIGQEKAKTGRNVLDKGRENVIYSNIKDSTVKHKEEIAEVYAEIMKRSKALQKTE